MALDGLLEFRITTFRYEKRQLPRDRIIFKGLYIFTLILYNSLFHGISHFRNRYYILKKVLIFSYNAAYSFKVPLVLFLGTNRPN